MTAKFDAVITVVEEMKERLIQQGCNPDKISVISNYENEAFGKTKCTTEEIIPAGNYLLYIGNYGPHRGLDTVIRAMACKNLIPEDLRFVIAGIANNKDTTEKLKSLVEQHHLGDKVIITGRVDFSCFFSMMQNAWANIIPHNSNPHTESTIPHKFYQSLMSGKPLIVSSCAPLKRFSDTLGLALVFEAGNPQSLAEVIHEIAKDYPLALQRAHHGIEFAFDNSWEKKEYLLSDLYERLSPQPPRTHHH